MTPLLPAPNEVRIFLPAALSQRPPPKAESAQRPQRNILKIGLIPHVVVGSLLAYVWGDTAKEIAMNVVATADIAAPLPRHKTVPVQVGSVTVGGGAPIVVQSMTNTDTADVESTASQVATLARAGSEIVRITVDRDEAAAAVPHIKERLLKIGVTPPIVGDFHYIGHKLLADHP